MALASDDLGVIALLAISRHVCKSWRSIRCFQFILETGDAFEAALDAMHNDLVWNRNRQILVSRFERSERVRPGSAHSVLA
jgi:hypothetical protein